MIVVKENQKILTYILSFKKCIKKESIYKYIVKEIFQPKNFKKKTKRQKN